MGTIIAIAVSFIYFVGIFVWIDYWKTQSEKYEKTHPFGSGTYNAMEDPGAMGILAAFWPFALIGIIIGNIFGIIMKKIFDFFNYRRY